MYRFLPEGGCWLSAGRWWFDPTQELLIFYLLLQKSKTRQLDHKKANRLSLWPRVSGEQIGDHRAASHNLAARTYTPAVLRFGLRDAEAVRLGLG